MRAFLAFHDSQLEAQWQLKFAEGQAGLDAAFSLQTLVIPSAVASALWGRAGSGDQARPAALDMLWLLAFLAWAPLFVFLAQRHSAFYLRHRTLLVLLSRMQRQLTFMRYASLFNGEAFGAANSAGVANPSAVGQLGMLLWRPGSLVTLLTSYLLPLRFNAPAAALMLVASLHSTLRQCTADCRGGGQMQAAGMYAGVLQQLQRWRLTPRGGGEYNAASCTVGSPRPGSCGLHACRHSCAAVHSWLQVVLGTLLPLLVAWGVEERSRQLFQRRWLQRHAPDDASEAAALAGLPRPVPRLALLAGFLACAWGLLVLVEGLLLRPLT